MKPDFPAMLATEVTGDFHIQQLLESNVIWMSQKLDGLRMQAVQSQDTILLNREGKPFSKPVPFEVKRDLESLSPVWWLDGELVGDIYWVFDCVGSSLYDISPETLYIERYEALELLFHMWKPKNVKLLRQWGVPTPGDTLRHNAYRLKRAYFEKLRRQNAEGVIFRSPIDPYQFGERVMVKVKFWKDADVILYNIGREGKRSAGMAVMDGENLRDVGSVKLTDDMLTSLNGGEVAVVKFLYCTEEGKLYQPSILRLRDDKNPLDCNFKQLEIFITDKSVVDADAD